jgi:hypothetical protein
MHDNNMTILRSFPGSFFDVQVGLYWQPPHHRVMVRVREPVPVVTCFRRGFGCPLKPLEELIDSLRSARHLIEYLDDGGVLGRWNAEPPGTG